MLINTTRWLGLGRTCHTDIGRNTKATLNQTLHYLLWYLWVGYLWLNWCYALVVIRGTFSQENDLLAQHHPASRKREINPPGMACGCPRDGVIKKLQKYKQQKTNKTKQTCKQKGNTRNLFTWWNALIRQSTIACTGWPPNSKHWFTSSVLQPALPYLVTP